MTTGPIEGLPSSLVHRIAFVLVNGRVPRAHANCAMCCAPIERGYVREAQTHWFTATRGASPNMK